MDAAVHDVEHRHRQHVGIDTTDVAVEREVELVGRGPGHRHRGAEDRVRAELALVGRAVEIDHPEVDAPLIQCLVPDEQVAQPAVDVRNRLLDSLAEIALAAVPQLHGLVFAGGSTRRNNGPTGRTRLEADLDFHRGIATGIEHLAPDHVFDVAHGSFRGSRDQHSYEQ